MKPASECRSLDEVRSEIDRIDGQIIALLGHRAEFVHAAARFKTSEAAVSAPERQKAMLETRRTWADQAGLSPDFIERLYRDIVAYFIQREREEWNRSR